MVSQTKKVDLSYIYEISAGDREFIKEMIETFIKITPEALRGIEVAQNAKDWKEVGRLAHKIKPTLMLLGDDGLTKKVKTLEQEAKQEINVPEIPNQVTRIKELCFQTISELEEMLAQNSY